MSVRKAVVSAVLLIVTPLLILNLYPCIMPHVYTKQQPHVCTELPAIADFGNSSVVNSEFIVLKQTNIKHPAFVPSGPFSKDLIVHSVHFDDRARNGHDNVTVFFVGVNKTIFDLNWIVGCGTGNKKASNFTVRFTAEDILLHNWLGPRPFPYEEIIVECYDLPVMAGGQAYVMYKTATDSLIYSVESEYPVFFPAPRVKPTGKHNFTVVTCAKVHDKGVTWLPEFIRYQKTLGVDHVHINILDTFVKDGGLQKHLKDPYLARAASKGYLSFTTWAEWYIQDEVYLHSEVLRKLDCIYRFRGTYDYAFSLDTDDFFTPRIPGQTKVKDYILKWCYGGSVGSCTFEWIYYFPGACGLVDNKPPNDGNVTKKLRSFAKWSHEPPKYKSLHLTSALVDATFHDATCKWCLMPGYKVVHVPSHVAYMAHLRMHSEHNVKCR